MRNNSWNSRENVAPGKLNDEGKGFHAADKLSIMRLFSAVKEADLELVESVLSSSENIINFRDPSGRTALHYAAINLGDMELVTLLIENGADVNARSSSGEFPIHLAITARHYDVIQALLDSSVIDLALIDQYGYSPMHHAVLSGDLDIVCLLVHHGAPLNIQDQSGWTPLLHAAKAGDPAIVATLLTAGSDVLINSNHQQSATDVAKAFDRLAVLKVLQSFSDSLSLIDRFDACVFLLHRFHAGDASIAPDALQAVEGLFEELSQGTHEVEVDQMMGLINGKRGKDILGRIVHNRAIDRELFGAILTAITSTLHEENNN